MPELYLLRQLAAFKEYGTLSEAAERLYLSQPALSRNMKKLEEEIGVPLFVRSRNKLELNENGRLTAELAEKALTEIDGIAKQVRDFERSRRTISLGVCAPAPIWKLTPLLSQLYPTMMIQTEITEETQLLEGLHNGQYQLIVLHFQPSDRNYISCACGTEKLFFSLPPSHRLAKEKELYFSDLDGENFLLMSEIGFWHDMTIRKMPHSKFLIQNDRFTFDEIVSASVLPTFNTDTANAFFASPSDRIEIPIMDEEAEASYFLVCLKKNEEQFGQLFGAL
ncbi:MAG: LysR family transcriptional regulator [Ruminococcus sp.]|nr:LysR family transcriptional regulator [Ruminococcus sp.]